MRRAYFGLVLLVVGLLAASCAPFSNSDAMLALPVEDDPTITFKLWFKVGSQNDPAGKEGLAHLTAQMLAEASTTNHSYEQILERLYPLAAGYSIGVDREMTVLTGRAHRETLDAYLPLFSDAYLHPAFEAGDFDRLKADVLNYLRNSLRFQSDEELGKAALLGFTFSDSGYAHPSQGTVQGVESITLDDVREFYARYYTRDNVVPAIGGGYDVAVRQRFETTLSALPAGRPEAHQPAEVEEFEGVHVLLVSKPDGDASISFGHPIEVRRGERDFYALWIANSWLGEHRNASSHLYQVIREARGMNYGDYSYIEAYPQGGRRQVPPQHVARHRQMFEVWIRTLPNEQAHFALRAAIRELKLLVDNGLTEEQFELTRTFLKKYVLHFADTTRARLAYAVDDRFYGVEDEGHLDRFVRMMDEITLDEVNAAVRKYLRHDRLRIAIVTGDAERLVRALVSDTPSPMSYASVKSSELIAEDEKIATFPLGISEENVRIVPVEQMFEN